MRPTPLACVLLLAGCELDIRLVEEDTAEPDTEEYVVDLGTGSLGGFAWLTVSDDGTLEAHIRQNTGTLGFVTAGARVLGFEDARARCPTMADDLDGDSFLSPSEAAAVAGGPVVDLAIDAPVDAGGNFDVDVIVEDAAVERLTDRVLVVTVDRDADTPAHVIGCGPIRPRVPDDPAWFDDLSDPEAPPGILGDGAVATGDGDPVRFEANLLCDPGDFRQELRIDLDAERSFHLRSLDTAQCAGGAFTATGVGVLHTVTTGGEGAESTRIAFTLLDEVGAADEARFDIDRSGSEDILVEGPLVEGELEAH